MKRLLLLLLLPTTLLSQTYNELMSIDNLDDFKKVMIENKYEFDKVEDDGRVVYGFGLVRDSIKGNGSEKWGSFNKDGSWSLQFNERNTIIYKLGDYDDIVESIKEKCSYVDIEERYGYDYVSYKCDESDFDGKIGFMISEGNGYISYFPNKE